MLHNEARTVCTDDVPDQLISSPGIFAAVVPSSPRQSKVPLSPLVAGSGKPNQAMGNVELQR